MSKKPLVILAGPTAVGKTKLSVALAKKLNGEIISADSMQVYQRMNIGTAKITEEEKQGVIHHLIDCLPPEEEFHVARFAAMAKNALNEIYSKGKLPIVVGGTGFYIQALLYDIDFTANDDDPSYRMQLEEYAREYGAGKLHEKLRLVDETAADEIHPNNVKRVIRALEFYKKSDGRCISEHNAAQRKKESPYNFTFFVLTQDREVLYRKIEQRIDEMLSLGLLQEVRGLLDSGVKRSSVAMQGLGYKEIAAYLCGECTLEDAVTVLKRDTRHFAKRQITWFKREKDVIWLDRKQYENSDEKILEEMIKIIGQREAGE